MPKGTKSKQLRDSYRFPGFYPSLTVSGLFGDSHARVIRLTRRSKKQSVGRAARFGAAGTIASRVLFVIFRVVASESISNSMYVGSTARAVKP